MGLQPTVELDKRLAKRMDGTLHPDMRIRDAAWKLWYATFWGKMWQFLQALTRNELDEHLQHEILQDAILHSRRIVLRGEFRYEEKTFSSYVKRIAFFSFLACKRRYQRFVSLEYDEWGDENTCTLFAQLIDSPAAARDIEELIALYEAIMQLDELKRSIIHLFLEGYTLQEIAACSGMKYDTMRKRFLRAVYELRELLGGGDRKG
jgi:RNA polymerase sigma factor (sigma-70 family)